jgi:hypothetical protein
MRRSRPHQVMQIRRFSCLICLSRLQLARNFNDFTTDCSRAEQIVEVSSFLIRCVISLSSSNEETAMVDEV